MKQVTDEAFFFALIRLERFSGSWIGQNGLPAGTWRTGTSNRDLANRDLDMMGQRIQSWQVNRGEDAWLSTLVASMEDAGRPERRAEPCDRHSLVALRAQLALPARAAFASRLSLRN